MFILFTSKFSIIKKQIIPFEALKYLNETDLGLKLAGLKHIDSKT